MNCFLPGLQLACWGGKEEAEGLQGSDPGDSEENDKSNRLGVSGEDGSTVREHEEDCGEKQQFARDHFETREDFTNVHQKSGGQHRGKDCI